MKLPKMKVTLTGPSLDVLAFLETLPSTLSYTDLELISPPVKTFTKQKPSRRTSSTTRFVLTDKKAVAGTKVAAAVMVLRKEFGGGAFSYGDIAIALAPMYPQRKHLAAIRASLRNDNYIRQL